MADNPSDLVQGTLDMLILKTLALWIHAARQHLQPTPLSVVQSQEESMRARNGRTRFHLRFACKSVTQLPILPRCILSLTRASNPPRVNLG